MVKRKKTFKIGRAVAIGLAGWPQSYQSPTVDDIPTPKSVDGSADVKFGTSMIPRGSSGDMASGAASMVSMLDRGIKAYNSNMAIVIHWTKDNDGNYLWNAGYLTKLSKDKYKTTYFNHFEVKNAIDRQYQYYNLNLLKDFHLPSPFSVQLLPKQLMF